MVGDEPVAHDDDDAVRVGECPICRTGWVRPRMYGCGHSVCETCMQAVDQRALTQHEYQQRGADLRDSEARRRQLATRHSLLVVYRCPMCRFETVVPWWCRPLNVALRDVMGDDAPPSAATVNEAPDGTNGGVAPQETYEEVEDDEGEQEEEEEGDDDEAEEEEATVPVDGGGYVNLAFVCAQMRRIRAAVLVQELMPALRDAAEQGRTRVTVRGDLAGRIHAVLEPFGKNLFQRCGVYRVDALTASEAVVHLVHGNNPEQCIVLNEQYAIDMQTLGEDTTDAAEHHHSLRDRI